MIKTTQTAVLFLLASVCALAYGQDIPAVTGPSTSQGFSLPDTQGALTFALVGSEIARTGYYGAGGVIWSSTISGDVGYLSRSSVHPFNAVYSGGYSYFSSSRPSTIFQNLLLSQTFNIGRVLFSASNSFRYLPESPIGGLSGLAGLPGIGLPSPGAPAPQGIISNFGQRVNNDTTVTVSRPLTGRTSLSGSGGYTFMKFLDVASGIDNNDVDGQVMLSHQINSLNSGNGDYVYSKFSYPGQNFSFITQSVHLGFSRQWNRRLVTVVSVGPQRTSSSSALLPSSINVSANASATYIIESHSSAALNYIHGVRSGSGVIRGAVADSLGLTGTRQFGEYSHVDVRAIYTGHSSLPITGTTPFSTKTIVGGIQYSRALGQYLSGYLSYTAQEQSVSGSTSGLNGFTGLSQSFAIGLTYSPHPIHIGHQ